MKEKVVGVLVLDGLGIGAMEDVYQKRARDISANTLYSISSKFHAKNLAKLGLYDILSKKNLAYKDKKVQCGRCELGYDGADSFIGHHCMIGNYINQDVLHYIDNHIDEIYKMFCDEYKVKVENSVISLDKKIFIANNIEADPGSTFNVIADLEKVSFSESIRIGERMQESIKPLRTIVMGGKPLNQHIIATHIKCVQDQKGVDVYGVDVPSTGIYNDQYVVKHISRTASDSNNLLTYLRAQNKSIALIGKTADLFGDMGDAISNTVNTRNVMDMMRECFKKRSHDFIFANVQEIDLAGHEENVIKSANTLRIVDEMIDGLIKSMHNNDTLIITADHGNDPLIGHSGHTREYVPIIIIGKNISEGCLGTLKSLNNIGKQVRCFLQ